MSKVFLKKTFWILVTPAAVLLLAWAVATFLVLPRFSQWARAEIESRVNALAPINLKIDDLEIKLIPLQASARGVSLAGEGSALPELQALLISELRLRLDLSDLLLGRTGIGRLDLRGVDAVLDVDPLLSSEAPPSALPMERIFSILEQTPLRRLRLQDGHVSWSSKKHLASGKVVIPKISLELRSQRIQLSGDLALNEIRLRDFPALGADVEIETEILPKELLLRRLSVKKDSLSIEVNGRIHDLPNLPLKPRLEMALATNLPLDAVDAQLREYPSFKTLPPLRGWVRAAGDIKLNGSFDPEGRLEVKTESVQIGPFDVGDAVVVARLSESLIEVDRVEAQHSAGQANITGAKLNLKPPYPFTGRIDVPRVQMYPLFKALDLEEVPVDASLGGSLDCNGDLEPLVVRCSGQAKGDRLVVRTDPDPKAFTIVELADMEAQGDVLINRDEVRFDAKLRVGSSQGETRGRVAFDEGFRIDFRAPKVMFADVKNLANLDFEGAASLEGWTEGDSKAALFDIRMQTREFVFENFTLGAVEGTLRYRAGKLHFDDLRQNLGRTQARGDFVLDLRKNLIDGQFRSDAMDAHDLTVLFSRIWQFPLEVQANGTARASFSGPLSLWKLTYRLEAEFRNGRLQGDKFDSFDLVAEADAGRLRLETAELKKNQSLIRARGGISPEQDLDILMDVIGLRLEESDFVNRVRSQVAGQLNMSAQLQGKIADPDMRLRGSLADIYIDEQEIPSSFFRARLNRRNVEGETNLFGNKIQGDFLLPFGSNAGPLRLRIKTSDWPFTGLLSLIGASGLQTEYESNLTADIDLASASGRFDQVSGRVAIKEFSLKRGTLALRNPRPANIQFENGNIGLRDFLLEGADGAIIRLQGEGFRLDRLNVAVQANSDLRLAHMFAPFLEDLGGPFQVAANVSGTWLKPQILGNASLQDAYVKIKGFPHPLERLRADLLFSQSRVVIQNIQGQLAGGSVRGDGSVQINGFGDIPVTIRARAEGMSLNVPDRVRTTGSADLLFSGNWFPFILSGTYRIQSGLVEMEFGDDAGAATTQRSSIYLPKILRQANFDPVILDLQAIIERDIQVKNSQMEGAVTGQLQVKGPPQNPILLGRINTERGSRIIVKDKPFELTTGVVNFTDPTEVNPELYLSAQARVEIYDVSVLIQGTAKTPAIRMSSVPPLSEQDIISLLALGITSQQLEGSVQSREQAAQLGYEALGLGLSRTGLTKGLESTTGINVQITSSFDNTKNISVPKLQLHRRLSDRLNAVYARPLTGDQGAQEVKMSYRINNNVSAVGSYEERTSQEGVGLSDAAAGKSSILGLDLEFKREFR